MQPLGAVVLAAGRSSRMGRAKASLYYEGEPLLRRIVQRCLAASASPVVVVIGCEQDADTGGRATLVSRRLAAQLLPTDARISVAVGCPDATPIDSLRCGLAHFPAHFPERHALLLWPVDHPFADAHLVAALIHAIDGNPGKIAVPCSGGRRGHPIVLGADVVPELWSAVADDGVRGVVRRDARRVVLVAASDPRITADINDPEAATAYGIALGASDYFAR